jgi:hypothetical protein
MPNRVPQSSNSLRDLPMSIAVRNGRCGTCPKLLTNYLNELRNVAHQVPRKQKLEIYKSVIDVLMETICDDLIAKCWRGWCLDNIYKPLGALRYLSETNQERKELVKLEAQMRTLSYYFLN